MSGLIYICSPYRGNVKRNKDYARSLVKLAIEEGYAPIAPHLYVTEVLNDDDQIERETGMLVAMELLYACDTVLVGDMYGISHGMESELRAAKSDGKDIIYARNLQAGHSKGM